MQKMSGYFIAKIAHPYGAPGFYMRTKLVRPSLIIDSITPEKIHILLIINDISKLA
jgi:hypothetical protein